jgi:hypothetical protein
MLNKITFSIGPANEHYPDSVEIRIDDVALLDIVRNHEKQIATGDDRSIAGAYIAIPSFCCTPADSHFLPIHERKHGVDILWCRDCGIAGCWPLQVDISAEDGVVVWSRFRQPHRDGSNGSTLWSYDDFGPFRFDFDVYSNAVATIGSGG